MDPTNCFSDSIKKPIQEPLGMPICRFPQMAFRKPQSPAHLTHTHFYPVAGSQCTLQGQQEPRQTTNERVQGTRQTWWPTKRLQISALAPPLGKQKGDCQKPCWYVTGLREGIQLRTLSKERSVEKVYLRRTEKTSESLAGLKEGISLPKSVTKDWRR